MTTRSVLWAAAVTVTAADTVSDADTDTFDMRTMIRKYTNFAYGREILLRQLGGAQLLYQGLPTGSQQQQQFLSQLLLLPGVLLHWAVFLPSDSQAYAQQCRYAADAACWCCQQWVMELEVITQQRQQQQQERQQQLDLELEPPQEAPHPAAGAQATSGPIPGSELQQLALVTKAVLPWLQFILQQLLLLLSQQDTQQAGSSKRGCSSKRSDEAWGTNDTGLQGAVFAVQAVLVSIAALSEMEADVAAAVSGAVPKPAGASTVGDTAAAAAGADDSAAQAQAALSAAWTDHAPYLLEASQVFVRLLAGKLAAPKVTAAGAAAAAAPRAAAADAQQDSVQMWVLETTAYLVVPAVASLCAFTITGKAGVLLHAARAADPGSTLQQQLLSVLMSLLKLSGSMGPQLQIVAEECRLAAVRAAAEMLLEQKGLFIDGGREEERTYASYAAAAAVAAPDKAAPACPATSEAEAAAVAAALPWLSVFGRCCLQWSQQLLQPAKQPDDHPFRFVGTLSAGCGIISSHDTFCTYLEPATAKRMLPGVWQAGLGVSGPVPLGLTAVAPCVQPLNPLATAPADLPALLRRSVCLRGLAAAGCDAQKMAEWGHALLETLTPRGFTQAGREQEQAAEHQEQGLQEPEQGVQQQEQGVQEEEEGEWLQALALQLKMLGSALSTVPISSVCNNPWCSNIAEPSELRLVRGRSCTCSGCNTVRYCSRECQTRHWKLHKPVCQALAAKGAAGDCEPKTLKA